MVDVCTLSGSNSGRLEFLEKIAKGYPFQRNGVLEKGHFEVIISSSYYGLLSFFFLLFYFSSSVSFLPFVARSCSIWVVTSCRIRESLVLLR
jgi:hypothetical protein